MKWTSNPLEIQDLQLAAYIWNHPDRSGFTIHRDGRQIARKEVGMRGLEQAQREALRTAEAVLQEEVSRAQLAIEQIRERPEYGERR